MDCLNHTKHAETNMESNNGSFSDEICLLCRCYHRETPTEVLRSQEPCFTDTCIPYFLSYFPSSWNCVFPSFGSMTYLNNSLNTDSGLYWTLDSLQCRLKAGGYSVQCFTLLWMLTLTAVFAVSSAAPTPHVKLDTQDQAWNSDQQGNKHITGHVKVTNSGAAQDLDIVAVDEYLEKFGYYRHKKHHEASDSNEDLSALGPALPEELHGDHTQHEREEAIKRMQKFFHLSRTGFADDETKKIMDAERCGVKDIMNYDNEGFDEYDEVEIGRSGEESQTGNTKRRKKRYAVSRFQNGLIVKWRKDRLTWQLEIPSTQLSVEVQKDIFRKALAVWGEVIPIELPEEIGLGEADIRLLFGKKEHGPKNDPAFDGRSEHQNTLAHAWPPYVQSKGFPGDVHFDEDDDWSKPEDLFKVALHELGHSFGLLHSEDRASIMFPVYQSLPRLGQDDLDAVEYLYGPESDQSWRKKPSKSENVDKERQKHFTIRPEYITRRPPQATENCSDVIVDAFLPDPSPHNKNFFIAVSGDRVHRMSPRGDIIQSDSLQNVFPGLPEGPDVGLSVVQDQAIFFIKGGTIWGYKHGSLIGGFPRSISEMGFPEQPQYAISLQDYDGNHTPLLFGQNYWWLFDPEGNITYKAISTFSRDLPDDVLFVAQWSDRRLYIVSNDSYVVLDSIQRLATHIDSIAGKPDWLLPLCEEIRRPRPEKDFTIIIVSSSVAGSVFLMTIGLSVYKFVLFYKKNYSAYI